MSNNLYGGILYPNSSFHIDQIYNKRVTTGFIVFLFVLVLSISRNNSVDIINSQFFPKSSWQIQNRVIHLYTALECEICPFCEKGKSKFIDQV